MKLSAEQIEKLYDFTRLHYVEYYDLQSELVDHLANAIEEQWIVNPKLSFEEALRVEFKKFGVFGFMEVVEKRQAALNKKYNKMVLRELKTFFSIPKIMATFSGIGLVYYVVKSFQESFEIMSWLIGILVVIFIIGLFISSQMRKKETAKTGKKWLLKEIIFGYSSKAGMMNILVQFAINGSHSSYPEWLLGLFSFLFVLLLLTEYIVLVLIPSKAASYLQQTYPEYEMMQ
ncbi:hypothetical protein [Flavobacterium sp. N1994]|uniref:hypothetical protein n=1 Tax=Flavobacterium sp. N1994 TaxID=2986827 RepID=UPI002223742A|nr:hypothetical protein [Flavobacterium sp. N1994]